MKRVEDMTDAEFAAHEEKQRKARDVEWSRMMKRAHKAKKSKRERKQQRKQAKQQRKQAIKLLLSVQSAIYARKLLGKRGPS